MLGTRAFDHRLGTFVPMELLEWLGAPRRRGPPNSGTVPACPLALGPFLLAIACGAAVTSQLFLFAKLTFRLHFGSTLSHG
jgi:hypothetical protein